MSYLPSIVVLGLVALVALRIARSRASREDRAEKRVAASKALGLATAVQSVHFGEEWATEFHIRFPALFGLEPMSLPVFVLFNLAWIAIWIASIPMLRTVHTFGFFAAWFLALAGMINAVAHPLMAIVSGGYFPGLISSPLIGVAAFCLWRRLNEATLITG